MPIIIPKRLFAPLAAAVALIGPAVAQAAYMEPLLRYSYDYASGTDAVVDSGLSSGASVAAAGTFVNDATRTSDTPFGFSTAAQDNNGGSVDYVTAGTPGKLNGLGSMTITLWVNFQSDPAENDRLVSFMGDGAASGLYGWDFLLQSGNNNPSFSQLNGQGYTSAVVGSEIPVTPLWQFLAVSYDATTEVATFFRGTEALAVASMGTSTNSNFNAGGVTTEDLRVGSTAASGSDRSPDALYDDVRVYGGALSISEIEAIRREAQTLVYQTSFDGAINTQPANWEVLVGNVGDGSTSGWKLDGTGAYAFTQGGENGVSRYVGPLENGADPASLADVVLETSFNKSAGNVAGLVARVQDDDTFYHVRLISNAFQMYRFDNGAANILGNVSVSDTYNSGETWSIRWQLLGDSLRAWLFNASGVEVAMLDVTDGTYAAGSVGVRAQANVDFESFRVLLVPEPTSLLMIIAAAFGFARRRPALAPVR